MILDNLLFDPITIQMLFFKAGQWTRSISDSSVEASHPGNVASCQVGTTCSSVKTAYAC